MKKTLLKIEGVNTIEKSSQKHINGGNLIAAASCGCSSLYFCANDCSNGDQCAFPGSSGGTCFGTIRNGRCCA